MKATNTRGELQELKDCHITVGGNKVTLKVAPEITDSKSAAYNDEPIIGRSIPLKTFSHGENRSITMNVHFVVTKFSDIKENLDSLRILESAVYPRDIRGSATAPYLPPPICKLECGQLFGKGHICAVMKSYSVSFPNSVPWDAGAEDNDVGKGTYLPYKITVNLQFDVIYRTEKLPGSEKIMEDGGAF